MPVLTAYSPVLAYGILGKGGLFVTPPLEDCLNWLTGSSALVGTGCADLQLTARHWPDGRSVTLLSSICPIWPCSSCVMAWICSLFFKVAWLISRPLKSLASHPILSISCLRFKWTHLAERLAYEKAVHHQRLRTEISQAKREADFFKANVEKSKRLSRKRGATSAASATSGCHSDSHSPTKRVYEFRQKETDATIRKRNQKKRESSSVTWCQFSTSRRSQFPWKIKIGKNNLLR